ncbi:hypothetical protein X798_02117 [Onchocerca flexuosa]|uniref:Uncharacterized protein n=1 Tax=Onchocerca flexuosa TaxID=387005 RepID=A0A238C0Q5_9BILA|nr:hypothetical protein X798_02117 [Onchocerca flexuosa]
MFDQNFARYIISVDEDETVSDEVEKMKNLSRVVKAVGGIAVTVVETVQEGFVLGLKTEEGVACYYRSHCKVVAAVENF